MKVVIPTFWHEISVIQNTDIRIGRLGALWYLINKENQAISEEGHHRLVFENGEVKGYSGSSKGRPVLEIDPLESPLVERTPETLKDAFSMIADLSEEVERLKKDIRTLVFSS